MRSIPKRHKAFQRIVSVLFCNFTGVYINEGIAGEGTLLDLSDISGTEMYIDGPAEEEIRRRIEMTGTGEQDGDAHDPVRNCPRLTDYRLRFLDNGNYHYMSRIFASYVKVPFDLITFDNHTDDQPPAFEGLKSCGSWRRDIAEENSCLKSSVLIRKYDDFRSGYIPSELPLYISIDKDVLSDKILNTNWDQGEMSDGQLFELIEKLMKEREIIAVDVCGEDLPQNSYEKNKEFNKAIISAFGKFEAMLQT